MPLLPIRKRLSSTQVAMLALLCALLAGAWALTYVRVHDDRRDDIDDVQRDNANLAIALEAHTASTLKGVDRLLLVLAHEFEMEGIDANAADTLGRMVGSAILSVYVTDAAGKVVLGSGPFLGVDLSDREFFRAHRAGAPGPRVSQPVLGRMTGKMAIPFTRRLNQTDGSFAGVIGFGIDPAYFTRLYGLMAVGRHGYAQIVATDGIALVRRVGDVVVHGVDLRGSNLLRAAAASQAGNIVTSGRVDGVPRFVSYRVLADYPLVVAVGQAVDEALEPYARDRRDLLISVTAFTVVILVLAGFLVLAFRKEARAASELVRSEALHRAAFEQKAVGVLYMRLDGSYIDANQTYCDMVGYRREELLGMNYQQLRAPGDTASHEEMRRRVERDGRLSAVVRRIRKDGSEMWSAVDLSLVRDADGRPEFVVVLVQDITERKRARALLEAQLDELRRFQRVAVDRELRMIEVEEENRRLREKASA